MKYCIRWVFFVFLQCTSRRVLFGGDSVSMLILMFLLSVMGVLIVCARGWTVANSSFDVLSVLIKLGGSKRFPPRDKPQLVCSVFGLNVLGFFVLFSHKYMIELQLSVMY